VVRGDAGPGAQPAAPRRGGLVWHRDFRLLWGGETVSELGSQITALAVPLVAVRVLHAGTFQVGALSAASTVAFLVVGLPAGAWVDRLRRRPVMIASDVGRALLLASVSVTAAFGVLDLAQLYVVTVLAGVLTVFFDVAYQSYLPALVGRDHLEEGNAKLTTSMEVAAVSGPAIAGGLVQAIGGPTAIALDALSFLGSAGAVRAIAAAESPPPPRPAGAAGRLPAQVWEGLRFVLGHPVLRYIAGYTGSANLFGAMATAVEVVFLARVLHQSAGIIGLVLAAGGLGGIAGAVSATWLGRRLGGARTTILGGFTSAGFLLYPLADPGPRLALFAAGAALFGFGAVVYNVHQVSYRQRVCPDHLLGRMNASMRFVVWGTLPIGGLVGGALGAALGVRTLLWLAGAGGLLSVGFLLASPLRGRRDYPPADDPPTGQPVGGRAG
jgi:MFS family permease